MPQQNTPTSPRHRGWFFDQVNGALEAYYNGTRILTANATAVTVDLATTFSSTTTLTGAQTLTGLATLTAGATTPLAYTSTRVGNSFIAATGNVALGNPGAFATTQPQGAVIMGGSSLGGIAPVGAIATAGAVFASDTVVRKIIADGTASNVET